MWWRLSNLLFSGLFLSSCTQANLEALETATVTCTSDADCTDGYYCETRLDPVQCRDVDERDTIAPELVSSSVTPAQGTIGAQLTATFEVNEPVLVDALNVYFEGGRSFDYVPDESNPEDNTFVFKLTLEANDRQGPERLVRAFVKDVGGASTNLDFDDKVKVDFDAPVVTGTPNLSSYRAGDRVTYRVRSDEPLKNPPTIVATNGAHTLNFNEAQATDETTYEFLLTTPLAAHDSGLYTVVISSIEDDLGNAPGEVINGTSFTVDATIPVLKDIKVENPTVNYTDEVSVVRFGGDHRSMEVTFTVEETQIEEGYPKVTLVNDVQGDVELNEIL